MTPCTLRSWNPCCLLSFVAGLLWACDPAPDTVADLSDPDDSATGVDEGCQHCMVGESNISDWSLVADVPSAELCNGCDLSMDWSGLTHDLLGQAIDPAQDIETVTLYVFSESETDPAVLVEGLISNTLDQTLLIGRWVCDSEDNRSYLSDCEFVGHPMIPSKFFIEGSGQWLLLLNGGSPNRLRSLSFIEPTATSEVDQIELSGQSATLQVGMDFSSAEPISVHTGAELVLDWSELSIDSWGAPLHLPALDRLQLDRLEVSAEEAGAQILSLDALSLERWTLDILGTAEASLESLEGARPFTGVEAGSTWLITLWCSTCDLDLPAFSATLSLTETDE